jgi:glycosyltransferase involved in cell wall biosynthesis
MTVISIHMTTYARYGTGLLQAAVDSVLSQSFRDFEFIITDDASTDGSADYLRSLAASDPRVRVLRNPRNVNSVSISLGRCYAQADPERPYVSWMFDDCVLVPGALAKLAERIRQHPSDVLFGVTDVRLNDGSVFKVGDKPVSGIRRDIEMSSVLVPNAGILVNRQVFDRVGWYDPSIVLRRSCDWDLFRRMFGGGVSIDTMSDVLVEEYGELQPDSLRNSFTTSFQIMRRFVSHRDATGLTLGVHNCLTMPPDLIPPGNWTEREITLMQYMFLEYFMAVSDLPRALRWARRLESRLSKPSLMLNNLRIQSETRGREDSLLAAGAYCGVLLGLVKETMADIDWTS